MDKDTAHNIICDIKKVAKELGRVPTRDEYQLSGIHSRHEITKTFKSWAEASKAAFGNLDKRTRELISVESILDKYNERDCKPVAFQLDNVIIISIGDTHFPFVDVAAMSAFYLELEKLKKDNPDKHFIVVQAGDLHDCFAQSRFPRSYNTYSPKEESELAYRMASYMWKTVIEILKPKECFQLHGNHTTRGYKQILDKAPSLEHMMDLDKFMKFDGVNLIEDPREELLINDVVFTHGWLSNLGAHRDYLMKSVVVGHSHLGGVSFKQVHGRTLFELNAGYFGNPMSKALSYVPTKTVKWTLGFGIIDNLGPRFVPL